MKTYEIRIPGTAERVRYWYDPSLRLWTVCRIDQSGDQVGQAEYGVRTDLDSLITMLQKDASTFHTPEEP